MRCHFVYSVPNTGNKFSRFVRKVKGYSQGLGLPISAIGKRDCIDYNLLPDSSPFTITKNLCRALSSKTTTLLYHLSESVSIKFKPDDIFLGHPLFPYSEGRDCVTELSLKQNTRPKIIALISPLHCNTEIKTSHINKEYLDSINGLVSKADILFAITGEYWWDKWNSSPYAHWKPKMVRLDMAIDTKDFPRVKKRFNPPGKRGFLYIGRNDPMKGTGLLSRLMSSGGNYPAGWIGSGPEIAGIPRISKPRPLTPEFMMRLAESYDFFITTGMADPNPTTILESMSWGFPVICTPQSGYYETEYLKNVYHDDFEKSLTVLNEMQFAAEEDLVEISNKAGAVVNERYSWGKFTDTVLINLGLY